MSTSESSGPIAALNLPKLNKPLIMFAKSVHDALFGNPNFPSPNPTLAVFSADIDAYEDADVKAAGRGKGAAALRDARRKKVEDDLNHLRDYVQSVAETQASPAAAAAVIESASMTVKKPAKRDKPASGVRGTTRRS